MRFMMLVIPKGYENAKPGFAPDAIRGVLGRGEWDPDADGGE